MEKKDEKERQIIEVVEEEMQVERRTVETGRVRVRKVVHEHEEIVDEPVVEHHVEIERVPVNSFVDERQTTRQEGETTIIPVYEEVVVVEKKLLLKEELHVTRSEVVRHEPQRVTLRKEEVLIERRDDEVDHRS